MPSVTVDNADESESMPREELLANEPNLLDGILEAARQVTESSRLIKIVRDGRELFRFRVRGLTDTEREDAQRKYTKFERSRNGMSLPDLRRSEMAHQRALQIYLATVDEDRARLWDNLQVAQGLVRAGRLEKSEANDLDATRRAVAVIGKVLYAAEIDEITEAIDGMGNQSAQIEELAGN